MPADAKPLFHPAAIRDALKGFTLPPAAVDARAKVRNWAQQLADKKLDGKKETELLPGFVEDVFAGALGYTRSPAEPYTLKREALIAVDGKFADAGLGRFGAAGNSFAAVLEGKGRKTRSTGSTAAASGPRSNRPCGTRWNSGSIGT